MLLLNDAEWSQWSDRSIAEKCGVSHPFVSNLRETLVTVTVVSERKFTTSTGKTATIKVQPKPEPVEQPALTPATPTATKPESTEPESVAPEQPQPKQWEVFDDISKLRQVIAKLHDNWVTESDRKIVRQFFRQCANEV
jgi:hypothetical protein